MARLPGAGVIPTGFERPVTMLVVVPPPVEPLVTTPAFSLVQ